MFRGWGIFVYYSFSRTCLVIGFAIWVLLISNLVDLQVFMPWLYLDFLRGVSCLRSTLILGL